jgi:hypothetical protein
VDAKSVSTREDQHLSFVVELVRSAHEMWNKPSMQHPEPALGIGNVLTADVTDLIAHVTIHRASKKRHPTRIAHASAYEKCRITSGGRAYKPLNFFRQMLTIRIEHENEFSFAIQPVAQTAFDRGAFPAVLGMNDNLGAACAGASGGGIARTIVNHENMIELPARAFHHFAHVRFFKIRRNDRSDRRSINRALRLPRTRLHR